MSYDGSWISFHICRKEKPHCSYCEKFVKYLTLFEIWVAFWINIVFVGFHGGSVGLHYESKLYKFTSTKIKAKSMESWNGKECMVLNRVLR